MSFESSGSKHIMKTVGAFAIFVGLPSLHFNSAPAWVFVLLGIVIGIIALLYYFAGGVGGEKNYWYGDPSRNYYLNIPPKWQVFGYRGYVPYECYGPFGGFKHF